MGHWTVLTSDLKMWIWLKIEKNSKPQVVKLKLQSNNKSIEIKSNETKNLEETKELKVCERKLKKYSASKRIIFFLNFIS